MKQKNRGYTCDPKPSTQLGPCSLSWRRIIFSIFPFLSFILGYFLLSLFFQKKELYTPNLIGKNLLTGLNLASQSGISVRLFRHQEDHDLPEGTILNQIPKAGQKIRPNQHLFLTISKRSKQVLMPNFLENDQKTINSQIAKMGFDPKIFWVKSYYPSNKCIAQSPQPRQEMENKELVFYLSSGNHVLYIVPNFKDCSVCDLKESLGNKNIKMDIFHRKNLQQNHVCQDCRVVDQKPMPGSIVDLSKALYLQLQVEEVV